MAPEGRRSLVRVGHAGATPPSTGAAQPARWGHGARSERDGRRVAPVARLCCPASVDGGVAPACPTRTSERRSFGAIRPDDQGACPMTTEPLVALELATPAGSLTVLLSPCLLYTSDAADDLLCVDL